MQPSRRRSPGLRGAAHGNRALARLAAALILVVAIMGTLGTSARPARVGAATTVKVLVTIVRVAALVCFDDAVAGGCSSGADFYARVGINNGGIVETGQTDDDQDIMPNWQFPADVDWDTTSTVRLFIEIRDEDDAARFDDDFADINPVSGSPGLDLTLHLGNAPCTFDGPGVTGTCGVNANATGDGSDGEGAALIIFRVDLLNVGDADGDGLADGWERNGITINGQFINLPAMGADSNKPDIFIHLDWMQDGTRNQALRSAAIGDVVSAFANAPYRSPTGSTGINLHVDQGPGSTLNFGTGATWGALSKAGAIAVQTNLGTLSGKNYDWTAFQAIKTARFEPTGRAPIFHYVIAAIFQEAPAAGVAQNASSGISRDILASDLIITLGGGVGGVGSRRQQSGTLMHELGHNLGLYHGGNEDVNYKPNYLSNMNYLFQMRGFDAGATAGVLDYSRTAFPDLDENNLNEANAIGLAGFGTGSRCPVPGGGFSSQFTANANGPFDWNCDGDPNDGVVSYDANSSGAIDAKLTGFDDWTNIKFKGGQIGQLGVVALPMTTPAEPPAPPDPTPTTTTVIPVTAVYSDPQVTLHATVASNAGTVSGGAVTFTVKQGTTTIGSPVRGIVSNGSASANFPLGLGIGAGSYTVVAAYGGNESWKPSNASSTLTVLQATTALTEVRGDTTYGDPTGTVVATLRRTNGDGGAVVGATVRFTIGGVAVCGGAGQPLCPTIGFDGRVSLAGASVPRRNAGTFARLVAASYGGDANHRSAQSDGPLVVARRLLMVQPVARTVALNAPNPAATPPANCLVSQTPTEACWLQLAIGSSFVYEDTWGDIGIFRPNGGGLHFTYSRNRDARPFVEQVGKTYKISATGLSSANYDVRYQIGTLTVGQP